MSLAITPKSWSARLLVSIIVTAVSVSAQVKTSPEKTEKASSDETLVLSPFTVTAEDDQGYRATNTLAGTRLKTSLRDIGAAVSVLTPEFFNDIGATDAGSALSYALGTETSGVQGNFAGGDGVNSDVRTVNIEGSRGEPQTGQRVRGLASATLTRNYFETDIAFDTYNVDSVTINRGPNALLFGIGSPGGIMEGSTKQAKLNRDSGEISFRMGQRDSYRATFDYNKVIIKDRLAVRLTGLTEDTQYEQRPAFKGQDRIYGAISAVVFENKKSNVLGPTIVRANFERGRDESTPPSVIPPGDGISSWFTAPDISRAYNATTNPSGTTGPFPAWALNGGFVPKYTVDPRGLNSSGVPLGVNINNVAGSVATPYFIQMSLVYTDPSAAPFVPGTNLNGVLGRTSYNFGGRPRLTWDYFANGSYYNRAYFAGYTVASLPLSVFDNIHMLLPGTTNRTTHDFDAGTITLEQTFFKGKAGIELTRDKESYDYWYRFPFGASLLSDQNTPGDVLIDVQQYLSNDQPNPNVGRMMLQMNGDVNFEQRGIAGWRERHIDRDAKRATAFVDLDFRQRASWLKWLGRHVVSGLYSTQRRETVNEGVGANWQPVDPTLNLYGNDFHFAGAEGVRNTRTQLRAQVYLESTLLNPNITSINDVHITDYIKIPLPKAGDVYHMYTYNRTTNQIVVSDFRLANSLISGDMNRRVIDTKALSVQSYLFNDNLVGLVGWREDKQTNTAQVGTFYLADGSLDTSQTFVWGAPKPTETGHTFSWSLVGHTPEFIARHLHGVTISPHFNVSENFNPVGLRSTILGSPLSSPTGNTREYGFTVDLLDDRLSVRFNWYKTQIANDTASIGGLAANPQFQIRDWMSRMLGYQTNGFSIAQEIATAGGPAGVFTSYDDAYAKFVALLPADVQAVYHPRVEGPNAVDDRANVINPTPTRSYTARGLEMEATANITKNWRLFANVAKQETIQDHIGAEQIALATYMRNNLLQQPWKNMLDSPALGEQITYAQRFDSAVYIPLLAATNKNGTRSLEQRKWRVNLGTNYQFATGWLKGFGMGAAARWQDRGATGYQLMRDPLGVIVPDLTKPFWAPSTWNGDVWVSYRHKIMHNKLDWSIQLNARNLLGDSGIIPVVTNPDGQLAVFRNPDPLEVFLTNKFSF